MEERAGRIIFLSEELNYSQFMKKHRVSYDDILWAYERVEDVYGKLCCGGSSYQLVTLILVLKNGERKKVEMDSREEAKEALKQLKEHYPRIFTGYPGGARLVLEGLPNTRDLGGYVTGDKKAVIPGRLIRSGALGGMTKQDEALLFGEYQVRTVVDFRTKLEADQSPEPELEGVEFLFCPILDEETAGFTHEDEEKSGDENLSNGFFKHVEKLNGNPQVYIDKLYQSLVLDEQAARQYGVFLNAVADAGEGAILWHCSAGKDRAGVGTALLLSVLGVPRETIIKDFVKTNEYLRPGTEKTVEAIRAVTSNPLTAECAKIMCEVRESYLKGVFEIIDQKFETMEAYVETVLGVSKQQQNRIREKYLI